jgi:hypothetical protein
MFEVHMNILFIIKENISYLLNGHVGLSNYVAIAYIG